MKTVSFESIVNAVNAIQDKEAREMLQYLLSEGFIVMAQEYMGMKKKSRFSDNIASGKLDSNTLNRMKNTRLLGKGIEAKKELPRDIQDYYDEFLKEGETTKNNKSYALISKKNCEIYVFNNKHERLSKNNVLMGPVGDIPPVYGGSATTPGGNKNGRYTIDAIDTSCEYFAKPSTYLQLKPDNRSYFKIPKKTNSPTEKEKTFSIGIHTYYTDPAEDRLNKLNNGEHYRETNGCINTPVKEAGPIYDNLTIGSRVVISQEPA